MSQCSRCGHLAMGSDLQSAVSGGLCTVCAEESDYGTPLEMSEQLRVRAAALRASNPNEPRILCANCEKEWAREWWYVCSRECRDDLVSRGL